MLINYHFTRLLIIRSLGFIYVVAFLIIFFQGQALWGKDGLLPIDFYVQRVMEHFSGSISKSFFEIPSLFYFSSADTTILAFSVLGVIGGIALLCGVVNFFILLFLWLLQMSFVNSGQLFYSYGWETQLLEFTFLAFFLVPFVYPNLKNSSFKPPLVSIWAMRWMLFRLMFGAGLIKLRGDSCWLDLTCLNYHYETQPNPHPLSYFFHQMPDIVNAGGVLFNHFAELVVPFGIFGPRKVRIVSGLILALFQVTLILSGNLAWLNWLTLVMVLSCFDDQFFSGFTKQTVPQFLPQARLQKIVLSGFALLIAYLSIPPAINFFKPNQAMNRSYDQWHLVNSYGAFGSIGKTREQIIIEVSSDGNRWQEIEFHCAPGDLTKRPCIITPYHYHLDWQIWFSSMRPKLQEEWLLRLVVRVLEGDKEVFNLFAKVPLGADKIKYIRMSLYKYEFASWSDWPKQWWSRSYLGEYMPAISLDNPEIQNFRKKKSL